MGYFPPLFISLSSLPFASSSTLFTLHLRFCIVMMFSVSFEIRFRKKRFIQGFIIIHDQDTVREDNAEREVHGQQLHREQRRKERNARDEIFVETDRGAKANPGFSPPRSLTTPRAARATASPAARDERSAEKGNADAASAARDSKRGRRLSAARTGLEARVNVPVRHPGEAH